MNFEILTPDTDEGEMSSFRQISTESHKERNYSVVGVFFFCGIYSNLLIYRKAKHISLKKIKLTREET